MHYTFYFGKSEIHIDKSWEEFFSLNINKIDIKNLGNDFTPPAEKVFRVFLKPLNEIKYIILGQDPYYKRNKATGRAFEVNNVTEWTDPETKGALQSIIKSIYYHHPSKKKDVSVTIKTIRDDCEDIPKPNELFDLLENNGVFLLNLSLTCSINQPNSHYNEWKVFSQELIKFIIKKNPSVKWFIWGTHARQATQKIDEKYKISDTVHPTSRNIKVFIEESGLNKLSFLYQ